MRHPSCHLFNPAGRPVPGRPLNSLVVLCGGLLMAGLLAARPPHSARAQDGVPLEPGQPLARELAGGATQTYLLNLAAGQFCRVVVEQRGIDVVVALARPDGATLVEVDAPNGVNGPELVVWVAEAAGAYRLDIHAPGNHVSAGRYEVTLRELRAATPQDSRRVAAQQDCADAKALRNQRTAAAQRQANEKYLAALTVWQALGESHLTAYTLNEMGLIYGDLGEYQQALDTYLQARAAYQAIGDTRGQAGVLNNLGWVYGALGEYQRAVDFYEQALQTCRALGELANEALYLSNIGSNYAALKEYRKALDLHLQVLALRRARNSVGGQAITLNNIANCYEHLGDRRQALEYYGQALALMPAVGNVFYTATTLHNLGTVYLDLGEAQKALEYFNQALALRQTIGDRAGAAATLARLARLERERGNLAAARQHIEAALSAVEALRAKVASPQLRASYFALARQAHEFNLDLLMRLHQECPASGFDARAIQASENARARSLLELLSEARAEIRQGVDPLLLERERALREAVSTQAEQQTRLLSGKHTAEQSAAAAKAVNALITEADQVEAQIRQTSPRYAALTKPIPLSLPEIQTSVLDDETLLLEYALGEERSWLWAVTPTALKSFALPKRAELEAVARRVYELLTARNQSVPNETPAQRQRRLDQADSAYPAAAAALSQMLLGPAAAELGHKRLLIVSDGVLQYIPFAALPECGGRNAECGIPLVVKHEIVSLPSASVLAVLRQETAQRKAAGKTLAVLADPVFQRADPRLTLANTTRGGAETEFVRLRFSRAEADEIASLAPPAQTLKALDFAANRDTATALGDYRIVHFATHAIIDQQHPELSGIVLSQVDEQGQPRNGFLRLHEIYNLRLGAELVVLSACETALGKEVKGEGMIGLVRGLMYAGAPRVAASLWRTDDRAAAALMKRFYQRLLGEGLPAAAALRAAQVALWQEKRWATPYFWAAFTLQGEWR